MTVPGDLPSHAPGRRRIAGAGTEEDRWRSAGLRDLPAIEVTEWKERFRRIWVVAPHPDDEVLALGGSLATLAALSADVRLVSVTDGEASHGNSQTWTPGRLAAARPDELIRGLRTLGASFDVTRLALPDGRVDAHRQALLRALADRVDEDDLMLVTCRFDGHPDHEACGEVVAVAAELTGATMLEYPVWMWHWATPEESAVPWQHARRIVLGDEAVEKKRAAIRSFTSQIEPDGEHEAILPPHVLQRFSRDFEVIFSAP